MDRRQEGAGEEQAEAVPELQEGDIHLVSKLEDFCSSGDFTQSLQEFIAEHAHKFTDSEEQDIKCYKLWQDYVKIMDKKLEVFLAAEKVTAEEVFEACQRINEIDP